MAEKKRGGLRIVYGTNLELIERDAQRLIRVQRRKEVDSGWADPLGIPKIAKFMHTCSECGETYWDSDMYGDPHVKCSRPNKLGF